MGLDLHLLRAANLRRIPQFKNAKGERAHARDDGADWSQAEWLQAVLGELGEFANLQKKVLRGDLTFHEAKSELAHELADVITYLDILALQLGIDLSKAVVEKFNIVSARVKSNVFITYRDRPLSYQSHGYGLLDHGEQLKYW